MVKRIAKIGRKRDDDCVSLEYLDRLGRREKSLKKEDQALNATDGTQPTAIDLKNLTRCYTCGTMTA
jgi:hypothetical protein